MAMETQHHVYEDEEIPDSPSGCGCFNLFRPFKALSGDHRKRHQLGETTKTWWSNQARKAKEVSELIAGPKWKNFIRKIGGYCNGKKQSKTRFQYDAQSYALNFDDSGLAREDQEEEEGLLFDKN